MKGSNNSRETGVAFEESFDLKYRDKALKKYTIQVSQLYQQPNGRTSDVVFVRIQDDSEICATFELVFTDMLFLSRDPDGKLKTTLAGKGHSPLIEAIIRDYIFSKDVQALNAGALLFAPDSPWTARLEKDTNGNWNFRRDPAIIAYENKLARELLLREFYQVYSKSGHTFIRPVYEKCHYFGNSLRSAHEALVSRKYIEPSPKKHDVFLMTYEGMAVAESLLLSPFTNRIFLIAKCCEEIEKLIELAYKPAVKDYDLFFQEKSEPKNSIHEDIWENIEFSKLVICDFTGKRPNCFIEYGYALGKGKHIILCVEESEGKAKGNLLRMPFDTQPQKYSFWRKEWLKDPTRCKAELDKFKEEIAERIARKISLIESRSNI